MIIDKDSLFAGLPPEWPDDLLPDIRCAVERSAAKIVVLDDDPTGTQTVHGISVLTGWDVDSLITVLSEPDPVVYVSDELTQPAIGSSPEVKPRACS